MVYNKTLENNPGFRKSWYIGRVLSNDGQVGRHLTGLRGCVWNVPGMITSHVILVSGACPYAAVFDLVKAITGISGRQVK